MSATSVQPVRAIVLSVEDDDNEQRLLKSILEKSGFSVLQANTAATGLQLFREHPVTLVVIDQRLGNKQMTGAQLARKNQSSKSQYSSCAPLRISAAQNGANVGRVHQQR